MIKKLKYGLTRRELEVLQRLILGQSYASTARALEIGLGTVQTHVKSLYRKLGVASKAEATAFALSRGTSFRARAERGWVLAFSICVEGPNRLVYLGRG